MLKGQMLRDAGASIISALGEDPNRDGLMDTPVRFAEAWAEWTGGYGVDPRDVLKTFEDGAEGVDEMVFVGNIPVHSHCEHHLAPFFGVAHIGYIPDKKIVGLSKFSRVVEIFARRLQVQERMTNEIADALFTHVEPTGVGVVVRCRHMCMESRGIRARGSVCVTSALRGALKQSVSAKAEFMSFVSSHDNVVI